MTPAQLASRLTALADELQGALAREVETVKVIAHAVRYRAGFNLLTDLIHSTDINRWTMTAGDAMDALRKEYDAQFMSRIKEYLCPELSTRANINRYGDCRKCKDTHGMRRGLIRN